MSKLVLSGVLVKVEVERLVSGVESLSIVGAFEALISTVIEETLHLFRGFGRTSDHLSHALCARSTQDDPCWHDRFSRKLFQRLKVVEKPSSFARCTDG